MKTWGCVLILATLTCYAYCLERPRVVSIQVNHDALSQKGTAGQVLPVKFQLEVKYETGEPAAKVPVKFVFSKVTPAGLVSSASTSEAVSFGHTLITDAAGQAAAFVQLGYYSGIGKFTIMPAIEEMWDGKEISASFDAAPAWWELSFVMAIAVLTLAFSAFMGVSILSKDQGTDRMQTVARHIREAANGFFRVQYRSIAMMSLPTALILFALYLIRDTSVTDPRISKVAFGTLIAVAFLCGAFCSALSGFIGMWVSVRTNVRVAAAAHRSFDEALVLATRGGAFSGFLVVALSALGISIMFSLLLAVSADTIQPQQIPMLIVGYGFGASFVALFAQLGGGIFTKAADVGADIIGKIEKGIPEDDVRNPAVVADLVGDNVGDCAGRGADLFESISGENIGAMILAGTLASTARPLMEDPYPFIMFPLVIRVVGLLCSMVGIATVRGKKAGSDGETLPLIHQEVADQEDPMAALNKGYGVTVVLAFGAIFLVCWWLLYTPLYPEAWWHYALCGVVGVFTSWAFVFITVYYTDYAWSPVRRIAQASTTGHGTNVIAGLAVGMEATAAPTVVIIIAILSAYWLGRTSGIVDQDGNEIGGLFGIAVATMGMLAPAAFILAMDTFGPITDNAGGICEMSQCPEQARSICDRMDAVGNTTKALTKGYAVGSAALAAFLLFAAFMDSVSDYTNTDFHSVDLAIPEVFTGALLGAALVFLFSALAIRAVGNTASVVITEVRKQFAERPGIMDYSQEPDYETCVAKVQAGALRQMVLPGLLTVAVPVLTGFLFRVLGAWTSRPNLGAEVSAGMLMVATIAGILMALFLNNGGGAWDNAKKYIEMGGLGKEHGKGTETHAAAVTGDTVGDPCKDTAGPSIHVLIKLLATITLVVGPLYLNQINNDYF